MAKPLRMSLNIHFSGSIVKHQRIEYAFEPKFCNNCRRIGHEIDTCGVGEKSPLARGKSQAPKVVELAQASSIPVENEDREIEVVRVGASASTNAKVDIVASPISFAAIVRGDGSKVVKGTMASNRSKEVEEFLTLAVAPLSLVNRSPPSSDMEDDDIAFGDGSLLVASLARAEMVGNRGKGKEKCNSEAERMEIRASFFADLASGDEEPYVAFSTKKKKKLTRRRRVLVHPFLW